jgi:hypothetical protein
MHQVAIHLFTLVAEQGDRHSVLAENLFHQRHGHRFCFLVPDWESLDPFREGVNTG